VEAGAEHSADLARASRAANGHEPALRELLETLSGRLHGIAWNMTHDHHEAEDLCQEALVKITAPAVLGKYRGEGPLDGYLTNVGVRAMISRQRQSRGWRERVELVDEPPDRVVAGAQHDAEPRGLSGPVRAALDAMPERARLVILLIVIGDLTYAETAATLGLEVGTVKSAYSRARAQLRASLSQ
jgi:RNA polymerase sigma-70 factor (ECF subfamily)